VSRNIILHFKAGRDADDWAYVCDQLGVSENQTERVPITFCNPIYGCNFSKCPHREEDDQLPLFRFPKVEQNATSAIKRACSWEKDLIDVRSKGSLPKPNLLLTVWRVSFVVAVSLCIISLWRHATHKTYTHNNSLQQEEGLPLRAV
jgi:hypothetical protein